MTEILIQIGLSNAVIALGLAAAAIIVEKTAKRPHLAHLLWLLVFVKLITPAVISVPVFSGTANAATDIQLLDGDAEALATAPIATDHEPASSPLLNFRTGLKNITLRWFPTIWLGGIAVVFAGSMVRITRFHRLLSANTDAAPDEMQVMASSIARRLGMRSVPILYTTTAPLSPMVWWFGGKVRIVIPHVLRETLDRQQLEWIVAHELAHVRRRDHWVRWIEWAGCVCFWWNPVAWWAQRRLRANEEICCDALVVSSLRPEPRSYANCLLTVIEHLAAPAVRPPVVASEINSGGFLERRFNMILSDNFQRKNSRWLHVCVLLMAVIVLPVSMAGAKDCDKTDAYLEQAWTKLQTEVEAGNMTAEEAEAKMSAIEKQATERAEIGAYFEKVWANLQAQVEAGTLTDEDAETMMVAVKQKYAEKAKRDKYEAVGRKIREAVTAGEITEEEARAKMTAFRKRMAHKDKQDVDWSAIKDRIEGAVKRGDITREEADAKYREIRAQMAQKKHSDVDWNGIKRRIEGAVERGDLTREEADAKYAEIKKRMALDNKKQGEAKRRKRYAVAVEEIKAAVEAGEITEEQAEERIAGMRRRIAQAKRKDVDWDGIKRRIEGAVERGELTREEADAIYAEIKKRMSGGKDTKDRRLD